MSVLGAAKLVTRWRCMGFPLLHGVAKTRYRRARCCRSPHYRGQNVPLSTPALALRSLLAPLAAGIPDLALPGRLTSYVEEC